MQRGLDAEIRWFTIKATLLDLHDNLIDTLYGDCYPTLERLELYRSNRSGLRDPKVAQTFVSAAAPTGRNACATGMSFNRKRLRAGMI